MRPAPTLIRLSLATLALAATAGVANAGGLGRPNIVSARAVGMGGAFSAIADDPSALHFNPGGLGFLSEAGFLAGLELVYGPRSYTPIDADGVEGEAQKATAIAPIPTLGVAWRLDADGEPSGVVVGIGLWNTFGGRLSYDPLPNPSAPAVNSSTELVFELVPGVGYRVNDLLSVGLALRLGVGLFAVDATAKPLDSDLSAIGLGIGATLGVLVRPTDRISLGAVWRSKLDVRTSGSGTIGDDPGEQAVSHTQRWPQQLGVSVALRASDALRLAVQYDWTEWSRFDDLLIEFPDNPGLDQRFDLDWADNFTVRGGVEYAASARLTLRAGAMFDSRAVPDRTIERQYLDGTKISGTAGVSLRVGERWRLDTALEVLPGRPRQVAHNRAEVTGNGWSGRANVAPGEYVGSLYTLQVAAQYLF